MDARKKDAPKKLKSLKLVRETLRHLDGHGPRAAKPFSNGHHCTLSWAG